ncbi:MAG TPA: succinylglutamate desuccinylase/aspartoacylase family protein [Candidatus Acidoferrales bacterium]|nr:succinylglutamate desuccinylase/aspartoacylase family protein [Candidatus Acidoferrales bacterium]
MPRTALTVGTCRAEPGQLTYGSFEGPSLPTGGSDSLAVIIAQGKEDGPVFWLTANIHGNEVCGIPVIQRLLTPELCRELQGTIVALPTLNPSGLRTHQRHPYYDDRDPNRTFPGMRRETGEPREPTVYERLSARLLDAIRESASYYVDLHTASILSVPFSIRDRVLYRKETEKAAAVALSERLDEMTEAFGFPVVMEYRVGGYLAKELHRSTTGAALQELRLPAFTVELGPHTIVDERNVRAAIVGLRNLFRWAGMLNSGREPMPKLPQPLAKQRLRREDGPYPPVAGILDYRVQPGDTLPAGGIMADLRDLWGRPIGDGVIRVQTESWVIGLEDGILAYPGAAIAHVAVVEDSPAVDVWPA